MMGALVAGTGIDPPHSHFRKMRVESRIPLGATGKAFPNDASVVAVQRHGAKESMQLEKLRGDSFTFTVTADEAKAESLDCTDHFQQFAENVELVFSVFDSNTGKFVYLSPSYERVWGCDRKTLFEAPKSWIEAVHADDRDRVATAFQSSRSEKREETYRILIPTGELRWIRHRMFPIAHTDGRGCRVLGIAEDITTRKRQDQQWTILSWLGSSLNVAQTAKQAADIILNAAQELFSWDCGTLDLYNSETDRITSVAAMDTFDGKLLPVEPTSTEIPSPRARSVLVGGAQLILRKEHEGADKTATMFGDKSRPSKSLMLVPIRMGTKTVGILSTQSYRVNAYTKSDLDLLQLFADHVAAALNRISAEEKRCEAEDRLAEQAALLELTPDAVMVRSLDDHIIFWNKGAERLYGWTREEVLAIRSAEMHKDGQKFEEIAATVMERGEWAGELPMLTKAGCEVTVQSRRTLILGADHKPKAVLIVNSDITLQKKLEAQMLRAQRLESIGTLAGGIAHDLNNVLAPILMSVQLLRQTARTPKEAALLDTLENSSRRGADLVGQVLTFARGMEGKRSAVNLQILAKEIQKVIYDTFPKSIQFNVTGSEDLWTIEADPTHVHQVLMNLCVNARDAMADGGRLSVDLRNAILDEAYAKMHPDAKTGPYVIITVEDTGTGIAPEVQEKMFDPFYTTKEIGKGTGLGLSTVLTIVKAHKGFINVYSELGRGTKFKIYFPAKPTQQESAAQLAAQSNPLPLGHGETILIVDDEANLRMITQQTLEAFGYRVLAAANGAEAVALYAQRKTEISAVLTDMMMPVMDGPATIVALRAINPRVKVIGSSGLGMHATAGRTVGAGLRHFLPKPYTAERLLKMLEQVLNEKDGQAAA